MSRERARRPWRRLLLAPFGVLLGLILAEVGLQIAAVVHPIAQNSWGGDPAAVPGGKVIVCVGDSHTYGLGPGYHPYVDSYPAQLQVLLNQGRARGPFQVEQRGSPGRNAQQTREVLRERLTGARPDLVLILTGYNNSWNPAAAGDAADGSVRSRLILPRLWRLFVLNRGPRQAERNEIVYENGEFVEVTPSGERQRIAPDPGSRQGLLYGAELATAVKEELLAMVRMCAERGIPVILQTYATARNDTFTAVNAGARQAAQWAQVPLIDHVQYFADHPEIRPTAAFQPDGHPTRYGYHAMAEHIAETLRDLPAFESWPFDAAIEPDDPAAVVAALHVAPPTVSPDGSLHFPLTGPPDKPWQLLMAESTTAPRAGIRLAEDELYHRSLEQTFGFTGVFDRRGASMARAYPSLLAAAAGRRVYVQLLLRSEDGSPSPAAVSETVEVHVPGE